MNDIEFLFLATLTRSFMDACSTRRVIGAYGRIAVINLKQFAII